MTRDGDIVGRDETNEHLLERTDSPDTPVEDKIEEIPDLGPDGLPLFGDPPPMPAGHDEPRSLSRSGEMPSLAVDRAELESSWQFICGLPGINQTLLFSGAALIVFAVLSASVPPAARGVGEAVRPYTAAGKQETCQSHLKSLGLAFAIYQQDNDDSFPPMDYEEATASAKTAGNGAASNSSGAPTRVTWVDLMRSRASSDSLHCPLMSSADIEGQSAYGYNSALAVTGSGGVAIRGSDLAQPAETLLLADRGTAHDVALLPPFPGWQKPGDTSSEAAQKASNIDFRHAGSAIYLYADGHAKAVSPDASLQTASLWGGAVAFWQGRERLMVQRPVLQQLAGVQPKGDGPGVQLMKGHRRDFGESLKSVLALWQQNAEAGAEGSKDVEEWGWRLARLWNLSGKGEMLSELNRVQARRSQAEWDTVQKAEWVKHTSDWGFSIDYPNNWAVKTESSGRYQNTTFTSGSPYITVLIEKGERSSPGPEAGIDWTGLESTFKGSYGKRYRRIRMAPAVLADESATLWEFELERRGEPKLRKLYIGRSHQWDSYVFVATAPSEDFEKWAHSFEQFATGLRYE